MKYILLLAFLLCFHAGFGQNPADAEPISLKNLGSEEYRKITSGAVPVLVEFTATWCRPCKLIAPILDELELKYKGKLKVIHVDIDDNKQLANQMSANEIPMIMMYKNGKALWTHIGVTNKKDMDEMIAKNL